MANGNGESTVSVAKQVLDWATKVATWATITLLAFFSGTVLNLDKGYATLSQSVESGFRAVESKLDRIEKNQDENSRMISEHEVALAAIKANRFTDEDSRDLLASFAGTTSGLDTKIQELWKTIADMKAKIPAEVPPAWFVSEVRRIESELKELKVEARALKDRVAAFEARK